MLQTSFCKSPDGRTVRLLSQVTDSFVCWLPGFSRWFSLPDSWNSSVKSVKSPSQPTYQAPTSVASSTWYRHFLLCIATDVALQGTLQLFFFLPVIVSSRFQVIKTFEVLFFPCGINLILASLLLSSFRQNLTESNGLLMEEVQRITI